MTRLLATLLGVLGLAGCASFEPVAVPVPPAPPAVVESGPLPEARVPAAEPARDEATIRELRHQVERLTTQLAEVQRRNAGLNEEHRRGEAALRESQRKVEELQQKLDALLAIDRDTRRRPKASTK